MIESKWRSRYQWFGNSIPVHVQDWLFYPSSLTQQVYQCCGGDFRVQVISQRWERPILNESRRLMQSSNRLALVRQIYLLCNGQPWVFARTVIPKSTLRGAQHQLAHIGDKSLGSILFSDPTMRRDIIEITCMRNEQSVFNIATRSLIEKPNLIWGRRTVYYLSKKPLLVSEFFLPNIIKHSPSKCYKTQFT